jgi:hypothetical protein
MGSYALPLVILALLLCGGPAGAGTLARHVGQQDPLAQGWSQHPDDNPIAGVSFGAQAPDADDLASWFVDDASTASGSRWRYEVAPVSGAPGLAEGWTLRGKLRVVALNDANDASVLLEVADGARRWLLTFGSTSTGATTVSLASGGGSATIATPTPGATAYHLFEYTWSPALGTGDLYVDGQLRLSNYVGFASSLNRLNFGGGSSATTGHGRYALVELLTGAQACRDGVDNDGDGLVDHAGGDPDCQSALDPHEESAAAFDSDFDGVSDAAEAGASSDPLRPDTDGDGLGDRFELDHGFDPLVAGEQGADPDGDGLDNLGEQAAGSDPQQADTDADGISDADELNLYGSNPAAGDSDGDGLADAHEVNVTLTSPAKADTDGDGLSDGFELATSLTNPTHPDSDADGLNDGTEVNSAGTDPHDADSDDDGLSDSLERLTHETDPLLADSDADGLFDGFEVRGGLDPLVPGEQLLDSDGDGLTNLQEQAAGSDPQLADSDGDGLGDGAEVTTHGTSPTAADSDADGLPDPYELSFGFDPLNAADAQADPDVDGLTSLRERELGTQPLTADSDADGVPDGDEANILGSDPLDPGSSGVQISSSSTLLFEAEDQPLFAALDDEPVRFPLVSEGASGQQGQIVSIDQPVPLWAAQQAWDQAVATCDAQSVTVDTQVGFCADLVVSPTQSECINGGNISLTSRAITCCETIFGTINALGSYPGCNTGTFTIADVNALPGGPYAPTSWNVGPGSGPRPTQPPPPQPFDVGARVSHDVSVEGFLELDVEPVDGGLVDLSYQTQATLRANASTVAAGQTFTLTALHRPAEGASEMTTLWPAASVTLGYEFDITAQLQLEYASIDPATGQQLHTTVTPLDEHLVETGELVGMRAGLFEGFELRFMNGVDYAPDGYRDVVWQLDPLPPGLGVEFEFTFPPTCPSFLLALTPACLALPPAPISFDLFAERFQIPELNSPASPDYVGGVVALNTSTAAIPLRGAIQPDGALVNTLPGRFRPLTNFTSDGPLGIFLSDNSNLSSDVARFELDIDGLMSLPSGGAFLAGVNFSDASGLVGLSFDVLDSDAVAWAGYEETLTFSPNLVADVRFDKPVEVFDAALGAFVALPAGQPVTLAVRAEGGEIPQALLDQGIPASVEVRQPPGGVQVDVTYSFRENRFDNETYQIFTVAWQNRLLELSLDGIIFDAMEAAGIPLTFNLFRVTASLPPIEGPRLGSSDPFTGVGGSDFAGAPFAILDLAADADGDGLPDALEAVGCSAAGDADSDDDGLADGVEDANRNGLVDAGETLPCLADSDGDGLQDGTERGLLTPTPDPDGAGPLLGTNPALFVPAPDPSVTSDPLDAGDPPAQIPALGPAAGLLLAGTLGASGCRRLRRRGAKER